MEYNADTTWRHNKTYSADRAHNHRVLLDIKPCIMNLLQKNDKIVKYFSRSLLVCLVKTATYDTMYLLPTHQWQNGSTYILLLFFFICYIYFFMPCHSTDRTSVISRNSNWWQISFQFLTARWHNWPEWRPIVKYVTLHADISTTNCLSSVRFVSLTFIGEYYQDGQKINIETVLADFFFVKLWHCYCCEKMQSNVFESLQFLLKDMPLSNSLISLLSYKPLIMSLRWFIYSDVQ